MRPWDADPTTIWCACLRRGRDARRRRRTIGERARDLVEQGARKVIVGTSAFGRRRQRAVPRELRDAIGRERVMIALDSKEAGSW